MALEPNLDVSFELDLGIEHELEDEAVAVL